eukprot:TRINITY_DN27770_c0_g1_i1.p1 TRINITY_DN27770_c0_g1~~TRINITY_DN27770_c0_g1_i1.p1  ORF type:complete len:138 (-),score=22.42 TRINITY_DN27770_c0_g1_i1:126-488(-)
MARAPAALLFLALAFVSVILHGCSGGDGDGNDKTALGKPKDCTAIVETCSQDFKSAAAGDPQVACGHYDTGLECATNSSCCDEYEKTISEGPFNFVLPYCDNYGGAKTCGSSTNSSTSSR